MRKRIKWLSLCAALLCLLACAGMSVGVAFGRYRTQIDKKDVSFKSRNLEKVWLAGGQDENALMPMRTQWIEEDGAYNLPFLIANGNKADVLAKGSMDVGLQIHASLGIVSPEQIRLTLETTTSSGEAASYIGVAEEIPQGGTVREDFGEGWVYRFFRVLPTESEEPLFDAADEFRCMLRGGRFEAVQATLTMEGEAAFASFLRLQVTAEPVE